MSSIPRQFLWALLTIDGCFIVLHLLRFWALPGDQPEGWLTHRSFAIDQDQGFAEIFQYLKLLFIISVLALLFLHKQVVSALAWALVFAYVLLDDALTLHERYSAVIIENLAIAGAYGARGQDFGEILFWMVVGSLLGSWVVLAYRVDANDGRGFARRLALLFMVLVLFGFVMDLLHSLLHTRQLLSAALALLEDRGEVIAASVSSLFLLVQPFKGVIGDGFTHPLFLALLVFGFAETVQGVVEAGKWLDLSFTLIEDGGELLTVSVIASFCLAQCWYRR